MPVSNAKAWTGFMPWLKVLQNKKRFWEAQEVLQVLLRVLDSDDVSSCEEYIKSAVGEEATEPALLAEIAANDAYCERLMDLAGVYSRDSYHLMARDYINKTRELIKQLQVRSSSDIIGRPVLRCDLREFDLDPMDERRTASLYKALRTAIALRDYKVEAHCLLRMRAPSSNIFVCYDTFAANSGDQATSLAILNALSAQYLNLYDSPDLPLPPLPSSIVGIRQREARPVVSPTKVSDQSLSRTEVLDQPSFTTTSDALPSFVSPLGLLWNDAKLFIKIWTTIPGIVLPLHPSLSGELDELSWTAGNMRDLIFHAVLIVLQLIFLASMPLCFVLPVPLSTFSFYFICFLVLNYAICIPINGQTGIIFQASPKPGIPIAGRGEKWIFINGISVGYQRPDLGPLDAEVLTIFVGTTGSRITFNDWPIHFVGRLLQFIIQRRFFPRSPSE